MVATPDWVFAELHCGNIRRGAMRPCNRLLAVLAVRRSRPDEVLGMLGVPYIVTAAGVGQPPQIPDEQVPWPEHMLNRPRSHAITTGGTGPSIGHGDYTPENGYRRNMAFNCSPKRCGARHRRREPNLAAMVIAAADAGLSTIYVA